MGWGNDLWVRRGAGLRALAKATAGVAALTALAPAPAAAQSATANARVGILDNGSITKADDMIFGTIAQSATAGTVVLTPTASATCTVTGGLLRSGPCQAAHFNIMGRRNNRVRIRENFGFVTLTGPGGATMTLNNLTIGVVGMTSVNGANGWNFGNYRIDTNNGITDFYLGGTLNVGAAQAAGVYNGTISIDIQFN